MSLRILLVSDYYPPFIGGAHRQTQLLGRELHKRGHIVNVVTMWQSGQPARQDDEGVLVHRLKELRTAIPWLTKGSQQRHHPGYPDPITVLGLRRIIAEFQPDIIHAYGWFTYSLAVALQGEQIPLLISARDYAYGCTTRTLLYHGQANCSGPAFRKCLSCAAQLYGGPKGWAAVLGTQLSLPLLRRKVGGVHSISSYVQAMVQRDFLNDRHNRAQPVAEAVIASFRESRVDECYRNDSTLLPYIEQLPKEPYMLFVGALRRVKGVEQLLAAYQQLQSPPPLVLIGTYEADSPRHFPAGVHVLCNFPNRAVMAAWEGALFGVMPSLLAEPLGSVIYEGMSCGKAVIGTKPGGHTDMIRHGETGLLTPQGDVEALRAAMQQLIDHPTQCTQFGAAAKVRAAQFMADISVPRFEQLYQQVIGSTGQPQQSQQPIALEA